MLTGNVGKNIISISKIRAELILLFGFIALFIFMAPGSAIWIVPKIIPGTAKSGYIDLSERLNESGSYNSNIIYRLDGDWEYYPNQLLEPADFEQENPAEPLHVTFPHSWRDDAGHYTNASGYATYRLMIKKPSNSDSIGVYSRFQYGAYRIFVNGVEVLEVGRVSEDPQGYSISYQPGAAYICPAAEDNFEIIIQIQNYDHIMAGLTGSIFCGDMHSIKVFTEFLLLLNGMMIGSLLILLCYFMAVYLQNRTKDLYLNFAVVTLMSLYVAMTTCNESVTYSAAPFVSPYLIFKLEYITQIIAAFFSTQYIAKKYIKNIAYTRLTAGLCIAAIAALAAAPSFEISRFRLQFQLVATSYYIVPIFLAARVSFQNKSKTALWEFISLLVLISGIVFTKLGIVFWGCVDLFPVTVTLYCYIQIVVLLYYYASIEEDLRRFNQTLEQKIEERTKELVETNKKAEAAAGAKSDFLAMMSHEIRTPMNAIIGMSDLIRTDNLDDTQKLYFTDIKTVSHSLLNIINDILDFSKIESGKFEITPLHYNFYALIDNICSVSFFSAKTKGIRFESNIDINIPAALYGDETRVKQVVSNITSNAIKYTSEGYVKLSVSRVNNGSEILFSVTDTGVGIKEEDVPRLFQLFEQLDRRQNRSVKGTGLGLAICRQLTERMGGRVEVESEYGVGSTFSIYLPLVEGDLSQVESPLEDGADIYAENAKILVVDDNTINLTVAKGILAQHNIAPDLAASGREAIEMVQEADYDLIFMDHMMPEMDGVEATAAIRALGSRFEELPIIALTANAVSGTKEFLLENGIDDFISKPISRAELNNILEKWLPPYKLALKAAGEVDSAASFPEETGDSELLRALSGIRGLNAEKGLFHVGGEEDTYKMVLEQFVFETPAYLDSLFNAVNEKDFARYAIVVHGIKGSLNSIGNEAMGEWAYMLERSAKAGDFEMCEIQNDGFTGAVSSFIETLKRELKNTGRVGDKEEKVGASVSQLFEMLSSLRDACATGDCGTVDGIADELGRLAFGDGYDGIVSQIITYAEHMDYDKVTAKISEWI